MNILKSGFTGGVVGWMYGGLPAFYHARKAFIERSHGELFQNRADAVVRAPRRCAGPAHPRSREPRPCPWGGGEDHTGGGSGRGCRRGSAGHRPPLRGPEDASPALPSRGSPPPKPPRRAGPAAEEGAGGSWRTGLRGRASGVASFLQGARQAALRPRRSSVRFVANPPPPPKTHPRCSLHLRGYVQAAQSPVV